MIRLWPGLIAKILLLSSSLSAAPLEPLAPWLQQRSALMEIHWLESGIRQSASVDLARSAVETLEAPFLEGTFRLHIRDGNERNLLTFDWYEQRPRKLFNLRSDDRDEGQAILERLFDALDLKVNLGGSSAVSAFKKAAFWAFRRDQLSGVELPTPRNPADLWMRPQRGTKRLKASKLFIIPEAEMDVFQGDETSTSRGKGIHFYHLRFPRFQNNVHIIEEESFSTGTGESGTYYSTNRSSSNVPFVFHFEQTPTVQLVYETLGEKALNARDPVFLNRMLRIIYPDAQHAHFIGWNNPQILRFTSSIPISCSQIAEQLRGTAIDPTLLID